MTGTSSSRRADFDREDGWVQVRRDSFARESLMRRIDDVAIECDFCGNDRRSHKGNLLGLFEYGIDRDGGGCIIPINGLFCSITCMEAYHA